MSAYNANDLPVVQQADGIDVRIAEAGSMTLLWSRLAKGVDLGPVLAALPGGHCTVPHWGYMIKGRLLMRYANQEKIYSAGEAFYWEPGHVPVALEDTECIDFGPTAAYSEMSGSRAAD
jgi:hypothetical protein